jgi:hypothetical protein
MVGAWIAIVEAGIAVEAWIAIAEAGIAVEAWIAANLAPGHLTLGDLMPGDLTPQTSMSTRC